MTNFKPAGIGDLFFDAMNLISQLAEIHLAQLPILQLLHELLRIFLINESLQSLDVAFIISDTLAQRSDVVGECSRFCCALILDLLSALSIRLELRLERLKLGEVLILNLGVLHFDDIELLFVLFARVSEAICELIRLLRVEVLLIVAVGFLCLTDLINLLLKCFILNLRQSNLIIQFCLCTNDGMLVIEVIGRDHVVHLFAIGKTLFKLSDCGLEVLRFEVKLLCANGAILLVARDSIIEEGFLCLHDLHQLLRLTAQSVDVLVRKHDCLDHSASLIGHLGAGGATCAALRTSS